VIITIDGPAASGKSTVSRSLAHDLHFFYINSGLLFRACAYILVHNKQVKFGQLPDLSREKLLALIDFGQLEYFFDGQEQIRYAGENITYDLRADIIAQAASVASTNQALRDLILVFERQIAADRNIVVDGRDTGSVVFPQAEVKIYLTASVDVRSKRWQLDQEKRGNKLTFDQARAEITERDTRDKNREHAPLRVSEHAHMIDSSKKMTKEVVDEIKLLVGAQKFDCVI